MPITFGQWLEGEMERRDMKQADFGRAVGIHQSLISKWISGKTIPDTKNCLKIARHLGVSGDLLLEMAGHREPSQALAGRSLVEQAALEQKLDTMIPAIESFLQDLKRLRGLEGGEADASAESSGSEQDEKVGHLVNHPLRKQGILVGA